MSVKVLEFKRKDWHAATKTLCKIADELNAGEHPECTVCALTMIGAKGEVTVFGLYPKCDDLQCLGSMRLVEQKLIGVLLDSLDWKIADPILRPYQTFVLFNVRASMAVETIPGIRNMHVSSGTVRVQYARTIPQIIAITAPDASKRELRTTGVAAIESA